MLIEKRKPMQSVHLRLPNEIREAAKAIAKNQSGDGVPVKEAEVYRTIIENFFQSSDTKCLQDSKQDLSHSGQDGAE